MILLVHSVEPEEGGCAFEQIMHNTPTDLIHAKLYSQIASPWFEQDDLRKAALVALSHELEERSQQGAAAAAAAEGAQRAAAGAGGRGAGATASADRREAAGCVAARSSGDESVEAS